KSDAPYLERDGPRGGVQREPTLCVGRRPNAGPVDGHAGRRDRQTRLGICHRSPERPLPQRKGRPRRAQEQRCNDGTQMLQVGSLDRGVLAQCFELGLMGIESPETYGGAGGNMLMTVLAVEELSAVDASLAIFVDVQNTLVNALLIKWASDEIRSRYLPRLATDLLGAYALSEPESGSDAFGLQTRATRAGGKWILEGRKLWITNGAEAGLFVIFANSDFAKG